MASRRLAFSKLAGALLVVVLSVWFASTARAQEPEKACMDCHADDAEHEEYRPVVVAKLWAGSVHRDVACVDCHAPAAGFDSMPHAGIGTEPKDCVACHEDFAAIQAEYASSVHAGTTVGCSSCHDPHEFPSARAAMAREDRVAFANDKCRACHNDTVYRVAQKTGENLPSTAHDWLPRTDEHAVMRCIVCHAPVEDAFSHAIVPKEQATRSCEACHAEDAELIAKYVGADDKSGPVTNPDVLEEAYVPGAVRNRFVDEILILVAGLVLLGVVLHGLLRIAAGRSRAAPAGREHRVLIYGPFLRIWHWTNAALVLLLAATGVRLHYGTGEGSFLSFETALEIHDLFGIVFLVVAAAFYAYAISTGDWRQYLSRPRDGATGLVRQARFYLFGIFRGAPHPYHPTPERRFNPLQQVAYAKLMYFLMPLVAGTGLILLLPGVIPDELLGRPGNWWVATAHYLASAGIALFLIAHLYLATTGERVGDLTRTLITGWHTHRVSTDADEASDSDEPSDDQDDAD